MNSLKREDYLKNLFVFCWKNSEPALKYADAE